jgi:hypothetical protein
VVAERCAAIDEASAYLRIDYDSVVSLYQRVYVRFDRPTVEQVERAASLAEPIYFFRRHGRGLYRIVGNHRFAASHAFNGTSFLPTGAASLTSFQLDVDAENLIAGPAISVMNQLALIAVLSRARRLVTACPIRLVEAPPGGGKTRHAGLHVPSDCVALAETRNARDELIKWRLTRYPKRDPSKFTRTIDSYLLGRRHRVCSALYVDEALMPHAGMVYAAVALSQCGEAFVFGDRRQLQFHNQHLASIILRHSRLVPQSVDQLNLTHRCPLDVTLGMRAYYPGLLSTNAVARSMSIDRSRPNPAPDVHIMCFKKADKAELRVRFPAHRVTSAEEEVERVRTVKESQGGTWDKVALIRLSVSHGDRIFSQVPQIIVALTRHRRELVYYVPPNVEDPVTEFIRRAQAFSNLESVLAPAPASSDN